MEATPRLKLGRRRRHRQEGTMLCKPIAAMHWGYMQWRHTSEGIAAMNAVGVQLQNRQSVSTCKPSCVLDGEFPDRGRSG